MHWKHTQPSFVGPPSKNAWKVCANPTSYNPTQRTFSLDTLQGGV